MVWNIDLSQRGIGGDDFEPVSVGVEFHSLAPVATITSCSGVVVGTITGQAMSARISRKGNPLICNYLKTQTLYARVYSFSLLLIIGSLLPVFP